MAVSVIVPKLAADEAGATLTEWYCQEGEQVVAGQPLCRLERDFVACEVEAEEGGVLSYAVGVGDAPAPGDVLAYLAPSADESARAAEDQPATLASSEASRQGEPEHEPDAAAGAWLSGGTSDGEAGFVWPSEREAEPTAEAGGERWGLTEGQFVARETAFWPNTEAEPEDAPEATAVEREVHATEPAWGSEAADEPGAEAASEEPFAFKQQDEGDKDEGSGPGDGWADDEDGAEPTAEAGGERWGLTEEQFVAGETAFWPNTEAEPEDAPEASAVEFEVHATVPAWGSEAAHEPGAEAASEEPFALQQQDEGDKDEGSGSGDGWADDEDGAEEDQISPFAWEDAGEVDDAPPEAMPAAIAGMPAADLTIEEPARQVDAEAATGGGAEHEPAEPLPPQPITLRIEIEAAEDTSPMTNLVFEAIVVAAAAHVDASACVVRDMRVGATQPAADEWAVLASYEGTGVLEATSRLEAGRPFSFALADRRSAPAFHEHGLSARHTMALALTYDGAWWSDEEGLRLLAEVGEGLARPAAEAA